MLKLMSMGCMEDSVNQRNQRYECHIKAFTGNSLWLETEPTMGWERSESPPTEVFY